jgi:hypothetical protein
VHYIKLIPYYSNDFAAYSFSNTYTSSGLVLTNSSLKAPSDAGSESLSAQVSVYPNPAPKQFTIRTGNKASIISAMLVDGSDRIVGRMPVCG